MVESTNLCIFGLFFGNPDTVCVIVQISPIFTLHAAVYSTFVGFLTLFIFLTDLLEAPAIKNVIDLRSDLRLTNMYYDQVELWTNNLAIVATGQKSRNLKVMATKVIYDRC
jgi:hypothetical protein